MAPRNKDAATNPSDNEKHEEKSKQPTTKISTIRYNKTNLPNKDCVVCKRPFEWRKKWERCWNEVRYCSERCRRQRAGS